MSFYKLKQGRTLLSQALPRWGALGRHLARLELGQALETGHRSSPMQLKMIIACELGQQLSELFQVVPSRAHVTNCDQVYLLLLLWCARKKVIILFVPTIDRWVISDRVLWPTHLGNNFHTSWRFSLGVRAIN